MVSRFVLMTLMAAMLAACSTAPTPATAPAPPPPSQAPSQVPLPSAVPTPGADSASLGLLDQAREARLNGDYERASGLLQRAQRVQPENAQVYLELSRLYREQGDAQAARHVAERGMLYCEGAVCMQLQEEL